jgi:hypothetical protein
MSEYESTVRLSMSRLDSEELVEKLKNNSLTDEARVIADEILKERGLNFIDVASKDASNFSSSINTESEQIAYIGYPISQIYVWMVTAFLFGVSSTVGFSGATTNSPGVFMVLRLTQGFTWLVIAGIIFGVYAYIKRKKITTQAEVVRRYGSNIKSIIISALILLVLLSVKLFFDYTNVLAILDIVVVASLTYAIFDRRKPAKFLLAAYAFITVLVLAFSGGGGAAGVLWAFVFLSCGEAILTEKKFSNVSRES